MQRLALVAVALLATVLLSSCSTGTEVPAPPGAGGGSAPVSLPRSAAEVGEVKVTLFTISPTRSYSDQAPGEFGGAHLGIISPAWGKNKRPLREALAEVSPILVKIATEEAMVVLLRALAEQGFFRLPTLIEPPVERYRSPTATGAVISVTIGKSSWMVERIPLGANPSPDQRQRFDQFVRMKEAIAEVFAALPTVQWSTTQDPWEKAFQDHLRLQRKGGQK
ncbi:MAG: hypothetical protein HZA54_20655 [Planctomycetes bacterium]|nr:hypothetical protein [Planctomycetota bacterium]